MPLVEVADCESLKEGAPLIVSVAGRQIALVKHNGTIHAVRNVCPHQTATFAGGVVLDRRLPGGTRTEVILDPDQPLVACPWHRWQFSLITGKCTVDAKLRVKVYPVTIESGKVMLEIGHEEAAA